MKNSVDLKFDKNGTFKILCIGDLHSRAVPKDKKDKKKFNDTALFMETALKATNPDFVVLLGDTLCQKDESEGFSVYKAALKEILKPILDEGIAFGYVLGNHEHDTKQESLIVEAYNEFLTCRVHNEADVTGNLNCCLPIRSSDDTKDAYLMWFIDSNNMCDDKNISNYDWVHKDQINWYEQKSDEYNKKNGHTVPSVLFQHIPVTEEYELLREARLWERPVAVRGHYKWGNKYYVAKEAVQGYLGEGPCAPYYNEDQFESWKKTGNIKGAFFGHDHLNDFTGKVDGIILGQNKTSGFFAYPDGCRSCVRLITLDENKPDEILTNIIHFKELGLKSTCLGPIMKHITDRQSINLHWASYIAGGALAMTAIGYAVKKLTKL